MKKEFTTIKDESFKRKVDNVLLNVEYYNFLSELELLDFDKELPKLEEYTELLRVLSETHKDNHIVVNQYNVAKNTLKTQNEKKAVLLEELDKNAPFLNDLDDNHSVDANNYTTYNEPYFNNMINILDMANLTQDFTHDKLANMQQGGYGKYEWAKKIFNKTK